MFLKGCFFDLLVNVPLWHKYTLKYSPSPEPLQSAIPTSVSLCPLSLGLSSVSQARKASVMLQSWGDLMFSAVLESEQSLVIAKLLLCLYLLATLYRSVDLQFNMDQCSFNIRSVLFLIVEEDSIAVCRWYFSLLSPRGFGIIGFSLMFWWLVVVVAVV